jgi:hypothetical protein
VQNWVFVLDKHHQPLMPCHPAQARELLRHGKAVVHKLYPFTIRYKGEVVTANDPLRLKIDPGAKTTGLVIIRERDGYIVWAANLNHRQFVTINKDGKPVTLEGVYDLAGHEPEPREEALWDNVAADPRQQILVAERESRIVGSLTVVIVPNLCHRGRPWAVKQHLGHSKFFRPIC